MEAQIRIFPILFPTVSNIVSGRLLVAFTDQLRARAANQFRGVDSPHVGYNYGAKRSHDSGRWRRRRARICDTPGRRHAFAHQPATATGADSPAADRARLCWSAKATNSRPETILEIVGNRWKQYWKYSALCFHFFKYREWAMVPGRGPMVPGSLLKYRESEIPRLFVSHILFETIVLQSHNCLNYCFGGFQNVFRI